ncbi:hypothetical protein FSP39_007654 [Pinctada imbricata]|uniref:RCC1-like domain-containing protein n=1 Tax=Pinctada imbricata TaxID=66713 RepID=A0AA89C0U1_PINIB|nr:hypothetical protein FSP39_007654 [Pinctada imbricata]
MPGRGQKRARKSSIDEKENVSRKKQKITHSSHPDLTEHGLVLTCGEGDVGQLGLGEEIFERSRPAKVDVAGEDIVSVVAGGMHTVCLTNKGEIYTFGCNDEGALGRDTSKEGSETEPAKVDFHGRGIQVSAGDSHSAVLTEEGKVYAWGNFRDSNGKIGLTMNGIEAKPIEIPLEARIVKISSGADHLVCLSEDGDLFTCGCAEQGQLGRVAECFSNRGGRKGLGFSDINNRFSPERVASLSDDKDIQQLEGGQHHTVALTTEGKVCTFGRGDYGRLGFGDDCKELKEPRELDLPKCKAIAAGQSVSFALTEDGYVFAFGMGTSKQLGSGDEEDLTTPEKMGGKQLAER